MSLEEYRRLYTQHVSQTRIGPVQETPTVRVPLLSDSFRK